jgi:hypothetical protein
MLLGRHLGIGRKLRQIRWPLVVEFNQNHRTLNAVIECAIGLRAADPSEPCVVDVPINFVHLHAGVSVVHVTDVEVDQIAQAATCQKEKY